MPDIPPPFPPFRPPPFLPPPPRPIFGPIRPILAIRPRPPKTRGGGNFLAGVSDSSLTEALLPDACRFLKLLEN